MEFWWNAPVSDAATVAPLGSALTPAERRALEAMLLADTEAAAAATLRISPHTLHDHLRNARSRLGVRTTRQAITAAGVSHVHGVAAKV